MRILSRVWGRLHRNQGGQVAILAGVMMTVLIGFAGLAIDGGTVLVVRTQTQNGADAAALAGAGVLLTDGSRSDAISAASGWAQKNGYPANETSVSIPPHSGTHAGDANYVEVDIVHSQPTAFMRVVGVKTFTISARAVAGITTVPKNYALVVLDKTACPAYNQTSNSTLTINGGGAIVNSSGTKCQPPGPSGSQGGGSHFVADYIDYYSAGSWSLSNNATTSVPPESVPGQVPDPLASLSPPVPCGTTPTPGCVAASSTSSGTAKNPKATTFNDKTVTLQPGTYYGGLKITGVGTVTFSSGVYIFAGGGFDYSGGTNIHGTGVTFYNIDDAYAQNNNGACGSIAIQGSGTLTLSAPTSGAYKNMLFWQASSCNAQMKYAGSSYTTTGIIYLPAAQLNVSGGGNLGALQIIVNTFSYSGSNAVTINYADYVDVGKPSMKLVE